MIYVTEIHILVGSDSDDDDEEQEQENEAQDHEQRDDDASLSHISMTLPASATETRDFPDAIDSSGTSIEIPVGQVSNNHSRDNKSKNIRNSPRVNMASSIAECVHSIQNSQNNDLIVQMMQMHQENQKCMMQIQQDNHKDLMMVMMMFMKDSRSRMEGANDQDAISSDYLTARHSSVQLQHQ
jgi:hypothetical protein